MNTICTVTVCDSVHMQRVEPKIKTKTHGSHQEHQEQGNHGRTPQLICGSQCQADWIPPDSCVEYQQSAGKEN